MSTPWMERLRPRRRTSTPPDLRRLEEASLNASATPRQILYDGWLVRLSPGKAKRARSINPFYASSSLTLDEKLATCAALYRDHGLPMLVRVTPFVSPSDLDGELAARGFVQFERTHVLAIDLARRPQFAVRPYQVEACDLDTVLAAVTELRGAPRREEAAHAERLRTLPLTIQGFIIRDGAAALCTGLVVLEAPWAGIFDVITAVEHRGHGLASALTTAMLDWADHAGADTVYLQCDVDNASALFVYRLHGFTARYDYWYRCAPDAGAVVPGTLGPWR